VNLILSLIDWKKMAFDSIGTSITGTAITIVNETTTVNETTSSTATETTTSTGTTSSTASSETLTDEKNKTTTTSSSFALEKKTTTSYVPHSDEAEMNQRWAFKGQTVFCMAEMSCSSCQEEKGNPQIVLRVCGMYFCKKCINRVFDETSFTKKDKKSLYEIELQSCNATIEGVDKFIGETYKTRKAEMKASLKKQRKEAKARRRNAEEKMKTIKAKIASLEKASD
jgi:hypothetical protein